MARSCLIKKNNLNKIKNIMKINQYCLTIILLSLICILSALLLLCFLLFNCKYKKKYSINYTEYKVLPRYPNSSEAAEILNKLDEIYNNIYKYLNSNADTEYKREISKNLSRYKIGNIYETDPLWALKYKASTNNKIIRICLRKKNGEFYDMDLIIFVFLHELSHIGTNPKYVIKRNNKVESDHPREFWATFKVLLEIAGITNNYVSKPYSPNRPDEYCDNKIEYNPVYDKSLNNIIYEFRITSFRSA